MAIDYCVVIPAHNAARFVKSSIDSVRKQTIKAREVVVVDDGSGDETAALARAAGAVVIPRTDSSGPAASRNLGVAETSAPIIAFLDADDEWMPDHAERVIGALAAQHAVFAGSDAAKFGGETGVISAQLATGEAVDLRDALIVDNPVVQSSAILQRKTFEEVGGYDESMWMSEDYDLWVRMAERGGFAYVNAPTVRRRMHDGQATYGMESELIRASWVVRRRAVSRRAVGATRVEAERLFALIEDAAYRDIERAIWTGEASTLAIVRAELQATDVLFELGPRFSEIGGFGSPARRMSQDLKCMGRSLLQVVRGLR
jgi:glycosyltransferase involved in cell wall biosynthesis